MMRTFTIEAVDKHPDGSVTAYGIADDTGEPIVITYPAGAKVIRVQSA